MRNLTLKQLRYFEAVARHAHFGKAALACSVSQPALSVQIKELEETLGAILFERGARHVRLTSFGEIFAGRAGEILRAVEELGDLARASRDKFAGKLRLGVIPTIAPYFLPTVISDLSRSHPDLEIHVRETLTAKLVDELKEGQIDSAIVALPVTEPTLTETPLFEESFLLVRPRNQSSAPCPSVDALQDMRLLLLEEGHCFRDQALSYCNFDASQPRDGLDGSSLSTLVQMVGAGIGVTMIPEMAAQVESRSAEVDVARFRGAQPNRVIGMIWRRTNPLAVQLDQVAAIVRQSAKGIRKRG